MLKNFFFQKNFGSNYCCTRLSVLVVYIEVELQQPFILFSVLKNLLFLRQGGRYIQLE